MKKIIYSGVLAFIAVSIFCSSAFSQNNAARDEAIISGEKVNLPYQTVFNDDPDAVLFDNGPVITLPAGGCAGPQGWLDAGLR